MEMLPQVRAVSNASLAEMLTSNTVPPPSQRVRPEYLRDEKEKS